MFVFGLILGPVFGLLVGDFIQRRDAWPIWIRLGAVCFALLVIMVLTFVALEVRVGLVSGILLGLLVSYTPLTLEGFSSE